LDERRSTCFIKMSALSIEGLRQAFLDPESRIRLNKGAPPESHAEFIAMAWQGGFLDGTRLHLNGNLNVLVGGRGTGKSTIVESLRYVMALIHLARKQSSASGRSKARPEERNQGFATGAVASSRQA
jgi:AAA15 family ATPase/GTPase